MKQTVTDFINRPSPLDKRIRQLEWITKHEVLKKEELSTAIRTLTRLYEARRRQHEENK